jgi:hypothetical protein
VNRTSLKWILTAEVIVVNCKRCGREISDKEQYEYLGETLCEDCYINIRYPAKACDPWAVYTATKSREIMGLKGTEGLTELQMAIYEFVKSNGKVTREDLMKNFNLAEPELRTQLAILRHCELVKGSKEDDQIYLVSFD